MIPSKIERALVEAGCEWRIEVGKRHRHIRVNGRLAGILPLAGANPGSRAEKNVIAQIRRAARQSC